MEPALTRQLCESIRSYRAQYLGFFLRYFEAQCTPTLRGGCFNLYSVTGQPYLHKLGDRRLLRSYCEHLRGVLLERRARNGYSPHVVHDDTNLAPEHHARYGCPNRSERVGDTRNAPRQVAAPEGKME